MTDRFAWSPTDLIPAGKADRDEMAGRAMEHFIRSGRRHPPQQRPSQDAQR